MDAYPQEYIAHNQPLVILSGFEHVQETCGNDAENYFEHGGVKIGSELPPISGHLAEQLRSEFLKADGSDLPWNGEGHTATPDLLRFKLLSSGRDFTFPQRKAAPPPIAPTLSPPQSPPLSPPAGNDLHSPLSPLSPSSPLFPDGVLTPKWVAKHQYHVPAVFVSSFEINANPSRSSLQDNQIKTDINAIKTAITRSGFKTRYAVVLVGDKTVVSAPELEERLAGIRRGTGLDPKNALFFLPPGSRAEVAAFVNTVLSALQPICIEYYRDLTKHARRKKNRGYVPPPTAAPTRGTSQTLSTLGWNVRYEFKQGVFAEFRQEMDVAERHFSFAIEELFNPEGVFETTPSWSPRWDEARMLCDVIALRVIRCQLWRGMTSGAAESWVNYKDRMHDLIDRRGKGTATYSWEAWEARWAQIMAELIDKADLPIFQPRLAPVNDDVVDVVPSAINAVFAPPEKAFSAMERLPPFHFLHHAGYFHRLSAKHSRARRSRAEAISEEDRTLPSQTPASSMAQRHRTYDIYMVPGPHEEIPMAGQQGFDYMSEIVASSERAEREFVQRDQTRAAEWVRLELAENLAAEDNFADALAIIRPVWDSMTWRKEQWRDAAARVLHLVHNCALQLKDYALRLDCEWEMMCDVPSSPSWEPVDFGKTLEEAASTDQSFSITTNGSARLAPVSLEFAFKVGEAHVGDSISAQITLSSLAAPGTAPITPTDIVIHFNGNPGMIKLVHEQANEDVGESMLQRLQVAEHGDSSYPGARTITGSTNLTLKPRETRVFTFDFALRDIDFYRATEASICFTNKTVNLMHEITEPSQIHARRWWYNGDDKPLSRRIGRAESSAINILPKPPKMQIKLPNLKEQYFTDEEIALELEFFHDEADEAEATATVRVNDHPDSSLGVTWADEAPEAQPTSMENDDSAVHTLEPRQLGRVGKQAVSHRLLVSAPRHPADFVISVEVAYHVVSDPETPISKTLTLSLSFVSPFESNYEFKPRVHEDPWPSFFSLPDPLASQEGEGILQRWALTSRVVSFASEPFIIERTALVLNNVTNNAVCQVEHAPGPSEEVSIEPRRMVSLPFFLTTRKLSLEDRRSSVLDISLAITWRRSSAPDTQSFTTTLAVPNLTIPAAEPRVLCTVSQPSDAAEEGVDTARVTYTLENPSMHFLTFTLTMEASDAFAFSGPKYRALSLTPMSRMDVDYTLLIYEDDGGEEREVDGQKRVGRWIAPVLRVTDAYFQKTLRIMDAGVDVKSDGKGGVMVWIAKKN